MMSALGPLAMRLLRRLDPERAHGLALTALRLGLVGHGAAAADPILGQRLWGLDFRNPIGLAAGFDKDAVALRPLMRLGFGFVEAGTVTLRPQPGNPRPRLFRLPEDGAIINRIGFNGAGLEVVRARLGRLGPHPVPLGVNIGLNKESADPERDYAALAAALAPSADYLTINVSSPNTPGLRALQGRAPLAGLLAAIIAALPAPRPVLVKIAPDLEDAGLDAVVETALAAGVAGLIIANTSTARPPGLRSRHAGEAGGLSGRPLLPRACALLARVRARAGGRLVLVGCGGVASGADALAMIRAGASLVQLYTGFAYAGPALIPHLAAELAALLRAEGFRGIDEAVGADASRTVKVPLPQ